MHFFLKSGPADAMALHHLYPAVIEQTLDVASACRSGSETAVVEANESGYLAGNQMYQGLARYI